MASNRIVDPNRNIRRVLYGLGISCLLVGVFFFVADGWPIVAVMLFGISGLMIILMGMLCWPYAVLSHEGVMVRFLLRKKNYRWNEIIQAGRYWRDRKSPARDRFSLVLVCPNGSPKRTGKDKAFLERNLMKAIALPNEREIQLFILENYGHLDFDDYKGISGWEKKAYELDET